MLTSLDESLLHQSPLTFAQTGVSDHRFFDRMWMCGHTDAHVHFLMGLAVYKNTNTVDGFFSVIKDGRQHNLRVSRPLLPDVAKMSAGPIAVEILQPLEKLRITVAAHSGIEADLTFSGTVPASLEAHHYARVDGRVTQDYSRFDQLGRFDGWIALNGERISVQQWFAARDHSWGVRPGMGGYEPTTQMPLHSGASDALGTGQGGVLLVALWFDTPSLAGYLYQMENGSGTVLYSHGKLLKRIGGGFEEVATRSIQHELQFVAGTRTCSNGVITVVTSEGETISLQVQSLVPPICYKGTGYDNGYNDERGLGVHRGTLVEHDVYDISHPEDVVLPDGRVIRPWHREAGAVVTVNGERGMAHFPCITNGTIQRYGLIDAEKPKP